STNRPPSPESARLGSAPCPSSETIRRSSSGKRFSVTAIVPFGSPGKAYLTAFVTSSLTISPSGIARATASHSLNRRLALAALLVARFQADHGNNNLQAVFDPVGQLLQQHADTLASDRMLALKPHALGDVFDRQQDQLYLVARP